MNIAPRKPKQTKIALLKSWFVFFTLISVSWVQSEVTFAHTLEYYQKQKDGKQRVHDALQGEIKKLSDTLYQREQEKYGVVRHAKDEIIKSSQGKGKEVQIELNGIHEDSKWVNKISRDYLKTQSELTERYRSLVAVFQEYYDSDKKNQEAMARYSREISKAETTQDLIDPKLALEKMYQQEKGRHTSIRADAGALSASFRHNYRRYSEKIFPYRGFLEKYRFPTFSSPDESVEKLEKMISYGDKRYAAYRIYLTSQFENISTKWDSLIEEKMDRWKKEQAQEQSKVRQSLNFEEEVGRFATRLKESYSQVTTKAHPVPCLLRKLYDVNLDILSYRETCQSVQKLGEKSSLGRGCFLLSQMIKEASFFMEEGAWGYISVSLVNLYSAPDSMEPRIQKLRGMKNSRKTTSVSLLEAIKLHDELLEEAAAAKLTSRATQ